jgi:hypothetical protein
MRLVDHVRRKWGWQEPGKKEELAGSVRTAPNVWVKQQPLDGGRAAKF